MNKRILYIVFLTGIFVVLFKLYFSIRIQTESDKKMIWINTTFSKNIADIVIVGDSRVYRGINPAVFEKVFPNKKAVNFAFSSAGISDSYLKKAIEKLKNKEGILVLGLTPFSLTNEAMKNEHLQSFLNVKKEEVVESIYFRPFMSYFQRINPQYVIDKRYKDELRLKKDSTYYQEIYYKNGWVSSNKLKHDFQTTLDSYEKSFSRTELDWKKLKLSLNLIKKIDKKKIKIFCFRPPIHPELLKIENNFGQLEFENFKKELIRFGVIWLDLPITTKHGTYDGSHLKNSFSNKYTKKIALKVYNHLK